jgi:streptomycin 6-kinase
MANGAAGRRWLDELPGVLATLCDRWDLEVGDAYRGGTSGYVAAATDGAGRPCVLKVAMPLDHGEDEAFARSVRVHRLADGRGCARLLDHDPDVPAMLLERLGPNLDDLGLDLPTLLDAVADALRTLWRPRADLTLDTTDVDLPTGPDKAAWLARYVDVLWTELDRPCERAIVDRARSLCDARAAAFDPSRAVLVHGDAHGWNTVDAGDGTYKLVDPEGLWSEPEHDLAGPMREYNRELLSGDTARLVRERADALAARCAVDARAVWEWGFIERVSTGLTCLRDQADRSGGLAFLEVARRCL